jgi:hypothetical protein
MRFPCHCAFAEPQLFAVAVVLMIKGSAFSSKIKLSEAGPIWNSLIGSVDVQNLTMANGFVDGQPLIDKPQPDKPHPPTSPR